METYHGHVRTPQDAIILFEACRTGLLPRVQRRLSEKERQSIRSGSVFVWDEREAGMRRWTDGKSWSASRVAGSFLNYREMEGKRGGNSYNSPSQKGQSPDDGGDPAADGVSDGYRYKPDGLIKQSFSITTSQGQHLHLISYYSRADPGSGMLPQPSTDPALRHVHPAKGMYPDASIHDAQSLPAVTRSPMVGAYPNTSPQPSYAAYAQRHQPAASAGYGWPPSPMNTPPAGQYSPHPGVYPPPSHHTNGQSPGYFAGQPAPNAARPPSGPTPFDRAPPTASNGSLPPPPFQNGHTLPLPRTASYGQPGAGYPPAHHEHAQTQYSALPPAHESTAQPQSQYPAYPQRQYDHPSQQERPRHDIPPPSQSSYPPRPTGPPTTNSASTIPSINSLINRSPEQNHSAPYARPSPPGGERQTLAQQEKSGFREDLRALRQLDRKFI